jgi:hypothetical protein
MKDYIIHKFDKNYYLIMLKILCILIKSLSEIINKVSNFRIERVKTK